MYFREKQEFTANTEKAEKVFPQFCLNTTTTKFRLKQLHFKKLY